MPDDLICGVFKTARIGDLTVEKFCELIRHCLRNGKPVIPSPLAPQPTIVPLNCVTCGDAPNVAKGRLLPGFGHDTFMAYCPSCDIGSDKCHTERNGAITAWNDLQIQQIEKSKCSEPSTTSPSE